MHTAAIELPSREYDVIVIGAGVVGCAMARELTLMGANVVVVEKSADIIEGASKGNSAILHTGFDAPPGSIEQHCVANGYRRYLEIHSKLGLPVMKSGALVLAWNTEEAALLEGVLNKARINGVDNAELLGSDSVLAREPGVSPSVEAGILIPGEYIIDPWTTPFAYILQAVDNGAQLIRNCEVLDGGFDGNRWRLHTQMGEICGKTIVNCAGLYGDLLDQKLTGASNFHIRPRKGQFVVYDKSTFSLCHSILLPVPGKRSKGIVVCPTVFGNVLVGPTAEEQESREDSSIDSQTLRQLTIRGSQILPGLDQQPITATYAGLRPATDHTEYQIHSDSNNHYVSVGGIRSTGLSAALGIAEFVCEIIQGKETYQGANECYSWPIANPITEIQERDWQKPDNGGIVCHCELVTRREIDQALSGPVPVASLGGLKRRTRVTMGRCQGFYCTAALSEITAGHFCNDIGWNYSDK
ncbi:MAG: NAD(P)/FAD-dependent oxidoreductase [Arenicellales bacterium]